MKQFEYKKDYPEPNCQGGIMAIKYMLTNGGKGVQFIDCGVILSGSVTQINNENQRRVIISLLSNHVNSDFYQNVMQNNEQVHGSASSCSSQGYSQSFVEEIGQPGPEEKKPMALWLKGVKNEGW